MHVCCAYVAVISLALVNLCSNRDIQLRAHLRWVSSGDFGIKIRAQTKMGIGMTVVVNNLEIDFPVWIQAHLQVRTVLFDMCALISTASAEKPAALFVKEKLCCWMRANASVMRHEANATIIRFGL